MQIKGKKHFSQNNCWITIFIQKFENTNAEVPHFERKAKFPFSFCEEPPDNLSWLEISFDALFWFYPNISEPVFWEWKLFWKIS